MGARPYILNTPAPKNEEPTQPPSLPTQPGPAREKGAPGSPNDAREGWLEPALPASARRST